MRQVYVHQATLVPGDDPLPAIDGPCHLTSTTVDDGVRLRILFAAEPHRVEEIRQRIDTTLTSGSGRLISSGCARVEPADRPHARRLLKTRQTGPEVS
jgi:hypothetical protein